MFNININILYLYSYFVFILKFRFKETHGTNGVRLMGATVMCSAMDIFAVPCSSKTFT